MRAAATLLAGIVLLGIMVPAGAQERDDANGAADFRTAPILQSGSYQDTMVTGESVWYALLYTNRDELTVTMALAEGGGGDDEATLTGALLAPNFSEADTGTELGFRGWWASDDPEIVSTWYLRLDLRTEGRLGVERDVLIDISGTNAGRLELCDDLPDCNAAERLAEVDDQLVAIEEQLANIADEAAVAELEAEVGELEARKQELGEELVALQEQPAPEPPPDPEDSTAEETAAGGSDGSSTPVGGVVVGVLLLAAAGGALTLALRRRRAN